MNAEPVHQVDELPDEALRLRPGVRLAHLLLRECLQRGVGQCRLVAKTGGAEVEQAGTWKPIMAFPPAVYDGLVEQFRNMAGGQDVLRLVWRGVDVRVGISEQPAAAGGRDLVLTFGSD